jgi:hypothetical protein
MQISQLSDKSDCMVYLFNKFEVLTLRNFIELFSLMSFLHMKDIVSNKLKTICLC